MNLCNEWVEASPHRNAIVILNDDEKEVRTLLGSGSLKDMVENYFAMMEECPEVGEMFYYISQVWGKVHLSETKMRQMRDEAGRKAGKYSEYFKK